MENNESIKKQLSPVKVILPAIIGLGVVVYMMVNEFDLKVLSTFNLVGLTFFWLFLALLMMVIRDFGYMLRLRILSEKKLSWKAALKIILLWEFSSAVTPSAVGGTSVAVFFIYKENISFGKSSAIVLATSLLDELYFVIMFPILLLIVSSQNVFSIMGEAGQLSFDNKYFYFTAIAYSIKFLFCALVFYALFINPRGFKYLLLKIFKLRFLKKWRPQMNNIGTDLITSSKELKAKPFIFWIKAFGATFFSWCARYWVVNFLILALIAGMHPDSVPVLSNIYGHIELFARQLVMWIMMLIMPTPGGSGISEVVFSNYLVEYIPIGFVGLMALLWRLVTYYPYLLIGVFVLPKWVKSKF